MDDKSRDSVLGVILFALGGYATIESVRMLRRAAGPPHRIDSLSLSPGMFPLILGLLLILFAVLVLRGALKGEENPRRALRLRIRAAVSAVRASFGDDDFLTMLIGSALLFAYCFGILGRLSFWSGSILFLLVLMTFLQLAGPAVRLVRAARLGVTVLAAVASVSLMVFLFEDVFGTVLP